jgi:hypothetical protein
MAFLNLDCAITKKEEIRLWDGKSIYLARAPPDEIEFGEDWMRMFFGETSKEFLLN